MSRKWGWVGCASPSSYFTDSWEVFWGYSRSGQVSLLGLLQQNSIDWVVCKEQKCIAHSSRVWNSKIWVSAWPNSAESLLQVSHCRVLSCIITGSEREGFIATSFIATYTHMAVIPFVRLPYSCPNHIPKGSSPDTITLGIRASR